ncbi:MAG: hypothetical protein JWN31_2077 [Frankiales bacterium]|nr:hypothetical protein [Frankiales bacterium]
MLTSLRRGLLAGGIGGLLAGLFGYLLAEPVMDRAVTMETARRTAAGEHTVDIFSRHTQHLGFLGATFAVGLAIGILYAVVHRLVRLEGQDPWGAAVRLGAAGFFALSLVPFLRYPANPPGTGDSATIDARSHAWTASLVIGLIGASVAGLLARQTAEKGMRASMRQLMVVGVLVATVALTFVLPDNTDPINAPVTLIWQFRLLSIATLALLWGALSAAFGLLEERARERG